MRVLTKKQSRLVSKKVRKYLQRHTTLGEGRGEEFIEEIRQLLRTRCKEDLWYLCYGVLGFKDTNTPLHKEMCATWVKRQHLYYTLWEAPRFHLKTTLWVIGDTIREALINPNLTQIIISAKIDNCTSMLLTIIAQFETNEVLQWLFPEYVPKFASVEVRKRCKWTSERVDFPARNNWISTSGNIEVMSVGASMVSKHYDMLRFDDTVNDINAATIPSCETTYNWFLDSWQLRVSDQSRMRITGTPWSFADYYQREIEKERRAREAGDEPDLRVYRRPVIDKKGQPIWSDRFSKKALKKMKKRIGSYKFACNFLLNPVPEGIAFFKRKQIHFLNELEVPTNVSTFIAVDLSEEDSNTPDHTVIVVVSINEFGRWYVRDIVRGKFYPLSIMETVARLAKKYSAEKVVVDATGFQTTIFKEYLRWSDTNRIYVPWVPMKFGKSSKPGRIRALQPIFERGDFWAVDGLVEYDTMEQELVTFDRGRSDDIIDALSMIQIIYYDAPEVDMAKVEPASLNALYGDIRNYYDKEDFEASLKGNDSIYSMDSSLEDLY